MEHVANSTVAGGVVMGTACDMISNPGGAVLCGAIAGAHGADGRSFPPPADAADDAMREKDGAESAMVSSMLTSPASTARSRPALPRRRLHPQLHLRPAGAQARGLPRRPRGVLPAHGPGPHGRHHLRSRRRLHQDPALVRGGHHGGGATDAQRAAAPRRIRAPSRASGFVVA